MNQSVLTLVPGSLPQAQSLGFAAVSVIVDNYTSSYVSLPDAGKLLPPWCYGAVVRLPPGIRKAAATLIPTVPAVPGPPVPKVQAVLTWTDQELAGAPGHLLQQVTTILQSAIGTLVLPGDAATHFIDVAVPVGTLAIGFIHKSGSGTAILTIAGDQTGFSYAAAVDTSKTSAFQKLDFSGDDTSLTFQGRDNGMAVTYDLLAFGYGAVVNVQPVGGILQVSEQNAAAAAFQAALFSASVTVNAVGTSTLVAGGVGVTNRIFGWSLASDGNAAGGVRARLQPHLGLPFAWHSANPVGATAGNASAVGCGVGNALDLVVDFLPAGDSVMAAVSYNQQ